MARKKNKVLTDEKKVFSKEEIQAGLELTHSEYFMQIMALSSYDPDLKELTFSKCPIVTPDGGTYLVSILHIDGPKINLRQLAEASEAIEKGQV